MGFRTLRPEIAPTDALLWFAAFVALVGAGALVSLLNQPLYVLVPIAAAMALGLVVRRFDVGIYLLIAATAVNRYEFAVAGWNVKIENVVVLVVLAAWPWRMAASRERGQRLPFALLIGALLVVNVLASFVNSADLLKSLRIIVRMVLAVATMYVILSYISDRDRLFNVLRVLLIVGAVASAYGIVALVVWHCFGRDLGVQSNPGTAAMSVKGRCGRRTSSVPTSRASRLSVGDFSYRAFGRSIAVCWLLAFTLAVIALALSLTRGAWLGFAAGAVLTVFFLRGARPSVVLLVIVLAVIGSAVVFRFNLGNTTEDVSARFATLSSVRTDVTAASRLRNVDRALSEWRQSPLLGWGTDGYHINHPDILSRLPCPELDALYDTGLVGLAAFVLLVGAIFFRSAVASTRHREEALATVLGALTIAAYHSVDCISGDGRLLARLHLGLFGLMLGAVRLINEGAPA